MSEFNVFFHEEIRNDGVIKDEQRFIMFSYYLLIGIEHIKVTENKHKVNFTRIFDNIATPEQAKALAVKAKDLYLGNLVDDIEILASDKRKIMFFFNYLSFCLEYTHDEKSDIHRHKLNIIDSLKRDTHSTFDKIRLILSNKVNGFDLYSLKIAIDLIPMYQNRKQDLLNQINLVFLEAEKYTKRIMDFFNQAPDNYKEKCALFIERLTSQEAVKVWPPICLAGERKLDLMSCPELLAAFIDEATMFNGIYKPSIELAFRYTRTKFNNRLYKQEKDKSGLVQANFFIDKKLKKKLELFVRDKGISSSDFINFLLAKELENKVYYNAHNKAFKELLSRSKDDDSKLDSSL